MWQDVFVCIGNTYTHEASWVPELLHMKLYLLFWRRCQQWCVCALWKERREREREREREVLLRKQQWLSRVSWNCTHWKRYACDTYAQKKTIKVLPSPFGRKLNTDYITIYVRTINTCYSPISLHNRIEFELFVRETETETSNGRRCGGGVQTLHKYDRMTFNLRTNAPKSFYKIFNWKMLTGLAHCGVDIV